MPVWRARVLDAAEDGALIWIPDAVVRVEQGVIAEVSAYDGRTVDEDLRPGVLTPGFVDVHVHYPQTRIVGAAAGPLLDWLHTYTFPEEARFADDAHAARVARRFVGALLDAGTTAALAYGPVFPRAIDHLFHEADAAGVRLVAGPVWMDQDCPPALRLDPEASADGVRALAERWHARSDRLRVAVIPRFTLSCSARSLRLAGETAAALDLPVTSHLSENLVECSLVRERTGKADYLATYEDAGLLRPGSLWAHCIHLSDDEWGRLAAANAVVAHCPDSNDFLGSGGMPVVAARAAGVRVAIGTDVAAGRSFRVPRALSHAWDNAARQGAPWSLGELLHLGTRAGARALGLHAGRLLPGYAADLALHDVPEDVERAEGVAGAVLFDESVRVSGTWVGGVRRR